MQKRMSMVIMMRTKSDSAFYIKINSIVNLPVVVNAYVTYICVDITVQCYRHFVFIYIIRLHYRIFSLTYICLYSEIYKIAIFCCCIMTGF